MYKKGARFFWIHNTGPIGCMPIEVIRVKNPDPEFLDEHGCIKYQNEMAMEFNKLLKNTVIQLRAELPKASLTYVDVYRAKYELVANAQKEGM